MPAILEMRASVWAPLLVYELLIYGVYGDATCSNGKVNGTNYCHCKEGYEGGGKLLVTGAAWPDCVSTTTSSDGSGIDASTQGLIGMAVLLVISGITSCFSDLLKEMSMSLFRNAKRTMRTHCCAPCRPREEVAIELTNNNHGDRGVGGASTAGSVMAVAGDTRAGAVVSADSVEAGLRVVATMLKKGKGFSHAMGNELKLAVQTTIPHGFTAETWYPEVVISYATSGIKGVDAPGTGIGMVHVAELVLRLARAGIASYCGLHVPEGGNWETIFSKMPGTRFGKCKVLLIVQTKAFYNSFACLREVAKASASSTLKIIPVCFEEKLPGEPHQWTGILPEESDKVRMLDAVQDRLRLCNKFPAQGAMRGKMKEKYMTELVDKVKAICPPLLQSSSEQDNSGPRSTSVSDVGMVTDDTTALGNDPQLFDSAQLEAWLVRIGFPEAIARCFQENTVNGSDIATAFDTGNTSVLSACGCTAVQVAKIEVQWQKAVANAVTGPHAGIVSADKADSGTEFKVVNPLTQNRHFGAPDPEHGNPLGLSGSTLDVLQEAEPVVETDDSFAHANTKPSISAQLAQPVHALDDESEATRCLVIYWSKCNRIWESAKQFWRRSSPSLLILLICAVLPLWIVYTFSVVISDPATSWYNKEKYGALMLVFSIGPAYACTGLFLPWKSWRLAWPKVQGLTSKFKSRFLCFNGIVYFSWFGVQMASFGHHEEMWSRASKGGNVFAAAYFGIFIYYIYWMLPTITYPWLHRHAWKGTQRQPWFWMAFISIVHLLICSKHMYMWSIAHLRDNKDIALIAAHPVVQALSYADMTLYYALFLKILVWDTIYSYVQRKPIVRSPFYLMAYTCFTMLTMYNLIHLVTTTRCWAAESSVLSADTRKVLALLMFTLYTVILYLVIRVVVTRCFSYVMVPVMLFPIHLLCDTFTEIVMADLDAGTFIFWLVLFIDVVLLVMRDAELWDDVAEWTIRQGTRSAQWLSRAMRGVQLLTNGDDVGADLWRAAERRRDGVAKVTPAMRQHVRRQTAASCALSEILSSVILLSFSMAEWIFETPMVVFDFVKIAEIKTQGKIGVTVYMIFLIAQVCALILSHHILEWKARRMLPLGKRFHVHAAVCDGIANQTTNAAAVAVQLMRAAFLSVQVDRNVKQVPARARGQSKGKEAIRSKNSATAQADALKQEMLRRRVGECCVVAIFTDAQFEPGASAAGDRMHSALHSEDRVFIITEAAYYAAVKRKLQAHFHDGLPRNLRVLSLGGSAAGLSRAADTIIRHTDRCIAKMQGALNDHGTRRKLSVVEERKVERGVGVRGGLMAVIRHKDPYFTFRLAVALGTISGMAYTQFASGKLSGAFDGATGANVTSVCNVTDY